MRILTVNVGSSSLKLRVIGDDDRVEVSADLDGLADLEQSLGGVGPVDAVGHRVVHGGERFIAPVVLDEAVVAALDELTDLAPLHQPPALEAIQVVRVALPDVTAVACFDTAFHAAMPPAASTYAVPSRWREMGVRRYGFHGLSHSWACRRAAMLAGRQVDELRVVTCHLGAGASLAAVDRGRSVDTTMGFTPVDGLVMATRSGSVDPGALLWLQQRRGLSAQEVSDGIEHEGGLSGLCGTADMRSVVERASDGDQVAAAALAVYLHRLRAAIAAMAAAMGGMDVLVFTGGVGERSPAVRAGACSALGFLGVELDPEANSATGLDRVLSPARSAATVVVVEAREDLAMAEGVRGVLAR
jgi:acetate kinase